MGVFDRIHGEFGWRGGLLRGLSRGLRTLGGATARLESMVSLASMTGVPLWAKPILEANRTLIDRHPGERCFIVATGASLLTEDLRLLAGEKVIALNEVFLLLSEYDIRPDYVVVQDPYYFSDEMNYGRYLDDLGALCTTGESVPILPLFAYKRCETSAVGGRAHYMSQVGSFADYLRLGRLPDLDPTRPLPGMFTVAHTAVAWAIMMGFAEIFLLGVDMDTFVHVNEPIRRCYKTNPYNDHTSISALEAYHRDYGWDYPKMLEQVADQMRCYAGLAQVAADRGARLVNATRGSRLMAVERTDFAALFDRAGK